MLRHQALLLTNQTTSPLTDKIYCDWQQPKLMLENLQGDKICLISKTFNLGSSPYSDAHCSFCGLIHLDNSSIPGPLRPLSRHALMVSLSVHLLMLSKISRQVDQELESLKVSISKLKHSLTEMVLQNQGGFDLTSHEIKETALGEPCCSMLTDQE